MTKKKKAAKKATKKAASGRRPNARKVVRTRAKSKKKKIAKRGAAPANRRMHRRYTTRNLMVTELAGDYRYVVPAVDISEGGIFLKGRLKTSRSDSRLVIPMKDLTTVELTAKPIYDRLGTNAYGTGYEFVAVTSAQAKALKSLLRNLD